MIRLPDAVGQPGRWQLTNIGLATAWIIKRMQAGYIDGDDAIQEIAEVIARRGQSTSEASHE